MEGLHSQIAVYKRKQAELSQQLTIAFEQLQATQRQQQLCKNQLSKSEIVSQEVDKNKNKMYRSMGRMFVLADPAEIKKDLATDIERITAEMNRAADLQKTYEAKKVILTQQLNDLTPKK